MMTSPRPSIRDPRGLRAVEEVEPLVDPVADELLELALEPVLERCGSCADLQNHLAGLAVLDHLDRLGDALERESGG